MKAIFQNALIAVVVVGAYTHMLAYKPTIAQTAATAADVSHPLDPLVDTEFNTTVDILKDAGKIDADSRFALITLNTPPKQTVRDWQPGQPFPRESFLIVRNGPRTFEAVVDIKHREVKMWQEKKGVQTSILFAEFQIKEKVTTHPDWVAAMEKRGYTKVKEKVENHDFLCVPLSAGYFADPAEEGKRLLRVQCFDTTNSKNMMFSRPIEGLTVLVDLNAWEVVNVLDTGVVSVAKEPYDFDEESSKPLQPPMKLVEFSQREGRNFRIDGHLVQWRNWSYHLRFERRVGTVVSDVKFMDGDKRRALLYQGNLSEVFVPYQDPDLGWGFKSYMDAGEYGFGLFGTKLRVGVDCPATAEYLSVTMAFDDGKPISLPAMICVFERYTGNPAWRHDEFFKETYEGRREVELVTRMISTVGNYDYLLDWVFTQAGDIRVDVGATGIDIAKGVETRHMSDATAKRDTRYGTLVAPNIVLPFHDHFFNFRLDVDIDGPENSVMFDRLALQKLPSSNPRRSIWSVESTLARHEMDAQRLVNIHKPEAWRVIHASRTNAVGNAVGYVLQPMGNAVPLLSDDDFPLKRAGFTRQHLWVTPYRPDEQYAGGDYPNQSKGDAGIDTWTKANRSIESTDIVVWYTMGHHHLTAAEDWPVLPTKWQSFRLRPFNFFDRSPVINLRK